MKPHKHAEVIKAWADGAQIQYKNENMVYWEDMPICNPNWFESVDYRIKPEPIIVKDYIYYDKRINEWDAASFKKPNVSFTFDNATGKLISAEVLCPTQI